MARQFEEFRYVGPFWSWVIIIVFSLSIVAWGLIVYWAVPPADRDWWHGEYPDTPGESIYSTVPPPRTLTPIPQIPALPEATPAQPAGGGS